MRATRARSGSPKKVVGAAAPITKRRLSTRERTEAVVSATKASKGAVAKKLATTVQVALERVPEKVI